MKSFTDHLNRKIEINFPPKRIVSLVPSQTELLFDLGLESELVGITRFCIHPKEMFESKIKIGGTKNCKIDKIRALNPDLIIANKEENDKENIEALAKEFPVWISDIKNLAEANEMILGIGELCDKANEAKNIVKQIIENFKEIKPSPTPLKVVYLIWKDPFMSINQDTFIHEMLQEAGFENVFQNEDSRYPEVSIEQIKAAEPDFVFLSSEPYPFKTKHTIELQKELPGVIIKLVDGEMFSWYGSRLIKFSDYINKELLSLKG